MKKYFDFCCHGIDKKGRPVYIERMGAMDLNKLMQVTTGERLIQYLRFTHETRMKIRFPICSELSGRRIEQLVVIQDCAGATMQTMSSAAFNLLR